MKRYQKILLIIGIIFISLVVIAGFFSKWLQNYSVEMPESATLPEPTGTIAEVVPDSTGWPAWKGLANNNHAAFTDIQTEWSNGLELLWQVDYLCKGDQSVTWSCPAVSGNHLVIPGRYDETDVIFCLNPHTGELYWLHVFDAKLDNNSYGEGPRATPTINDDRVYVLSRGGLLQCLNLTDGTVIWKRDYLEMGGKEPTWGFSGSPVIFGNTLIVQVGNKALVYGLDKITGETLWQSEGAPASYSTPVVIQQENEPLLLTLGGQDFYALNPTSGETYWQTPWDVKNNINICTPDYSPEHKIAVISSWYNKGTQAVKISKAEPEILWHSDQLMAHQTDPMILGDYVYGYSGMSAHNRDEFKCLDLLTGEEQWASSELGSGQFIYIEPYFLSIDIKGSLYLSKPSTQGLEIVTKIDNLIPTENARLWTKPVAAHGNLYLRYANQLYCYKLAK